MKKINMLLAVLSVASCGFVHAFDNGAKSFCFVLKPKIPARDTAAFFSVLAQNVVDMPENVKDLVPFEGLLDPKARPVVFVKRSDGSMSPAIVFAEGTDSYSVGVLSLSVKHGIKREDMKVISEGQAVDGGSSDEGATTVLLGDNDA